MHEHGAGAPSTPTKRDADTIGRVTAFLTAA
jgi:hypothetical protein